MRFQVLHDYKVDFPGMDTTACVVQSGRVAHASITFHHCVARRDSQFEACNDTTLILSKHTGPVTIKSTLQIKLQFNCTK